MFHVNHTLYVRHKPSQTDGSATNSLNPFGRDFGCVNLVPWSFQLQCTLRQIALFRCFGFRAQCRGILGLGFDSDMLRSGAWEFGKLC